MAATQSALTVVNSTQRRRFEILTAVMARMFAPSKILRP